VGGTKQKVLSRLLIRWDRTLIPAVPPGLALRARFQVIGMCLAHG